MSGANNTDAESGEQQPDAFQSAAFWTTYHDRHGVTKQQRTSRRLFELGERTRHAVLQAVFKDEPAQSNCRMDWPSDSVPHTQQQPAQPVCSNGMERGGTAYSSPGVGRRGSLEPPWATVPRTVVECRGRKHRSQVTDAPLTRFGNKRSRDAFYGSPSSSTGRLSAHSVARSEQSEHNKQEPCHWDACDADTEALALECVLRTVIMSKCLDTYIEYGPVGRPRAVPGLFCAREFSSLVRHCKQDTHILTHEPYKLFQSQVNYAHRVLSLFLKSLTECSDAPSTNCQCSVVCSSATQPCYCMWHSQLVAHAVRCSRSYNSATQAHMQLKQYFQLVPAVAPGHYGDSRNLLPVEFDVRDTSHHMCRFKTVYSSGEEFYAHTVGIKATLVVLEAQCSKRVKLITYTPEHACHDQKSWCAYSHKAATLAIQGPHACITELLVGMTVHSFLSCPQTHHQNVSMQLGNAVWSVFRLVLWHDRVELKQSQLFSLSHSNVQRRLLYVLDAWCSACTAMDAMNDMLKPEFYWRNLEHVAHVQDLKALRKKLQLRFKCLADTTCAGS